jgi:hypothetical protein
MFALLPTLMLPFSTMMTLSDVGALPVPLPSTHGCREE